MNHYTPFKRILSKPYPTSDASGLHYDRYGFHFEYLHMVSILTCQFYLTLPIHQYLPDISGVVEYIIHCLKIRGRVVNMFSVTV